MRRILIGVLLTISVFAGAKEPGELQRFPGSQATFSPDGKYLQVVNENSTDIYDTRTFKCECSFKGIVEYFSPEYWILRTADGYQVRSPQGNITDLFGAGLSSDYQYYYQIITNTLILGSPSGKIIATFPAPGGTFKIYGHLLVKTKDEYPSDLYSVYDMASGKLLISDSTLINIDFRNRYVFFSQKTGYNISINKVMDTSDQSIVLETKDNVDQFMPQGYFLTTRPSYNSNRIWDLTQGKEIGVFEGKIHSVSPNGKYAVGTLNRIDQYRTVNAAVLLNLEKHDVVYGKNADSYPMITWPFFSPSGKNAVFVTGTFSGATETSKNPVPVLINSSVMIIDLATQTKLEKGDAGDVIFSSNWQYLAINNEVWDLDKAAPVLSLTGAPIIFGQNNKFVVYHDNKNMYIGWLDGNKRIDKITGELYNAKLLDNRYLQLDYSGNRFIDLYTGVPLNNLAEVIRAVSPDGKLAAFLVIKETKTGSLSTKNPYIAVVDWQKWQKSQGKKIAWEKYGVWVRRLIIILVIIGVIVALYYIGKATEKAEETKRKAEALSSFRLRLQNTANWWKKRELAVAKCDVCSTAIHPGNSIYMTTDEVFNSYEYGNKIVNMVAESLKVPSYQVDRYKAVEFVKKNVRDKSSDDIFMICSDCQKKYFETQIYKSEKEYVLNLCQKEIAEVTNLKNSLSQLPEVENFMTAVIHFQNENYRDALTELLKFSEHNPDNMPCYNMIAGCYFFLNKPDKAKEYAMKVLAVSPEDEGALTIMKTLGEDVNINLEALSHDKVKSEPAGGVKFLRKEENPDGCRYEIYEADDAETAKEFLRGKTVTEPKYYIVVETPQGNWGVDKEAIYLEHLQPFQKNLDLGTVPGRACSIPSNFNLVFASTGHNDNFAVDIECGSCGHIWLDGIRYQNKTVVKCPKCGTYNTVDSSNYKVV